MNRSPSTARRSARPLAAVAVAAAAATAAVAAAGLAGSPATAATAATTLTATGSAWVSAAAPATNYSGQLTLAEQAAPATKIGLLRFDASALPATATVTSATVQVYVADAPAPFSVAGVTGSWSPSTVTWNSRPAVGSAVATAGAVTATGWVSLDVTRAVRTGGRVDLALTTTASTTLRISGVNSTHVPRLLVTTGTATAAPTTSAPAPSTSAPAGGPSKILLFVEENHPTSALSGMPYLAGLANSYAKATNYWAVTHPSLPNYLALAGGSTFGVTDDAGPSSHPIRGTSVFGQALAAGKTAKVYAETAPGNCALSNSGSYAVRHTGWPYFVDERTQCGRYDVPMGTPTSGNLTADVAGGRLPTVGWAIPNLCNDAHDCSLSVADNWLKSWLPVVMNGADYKAGRLAIVVTFDEGDSTSNNIPFVVVSPYVHGVVDSTRYTHYSLVRAFDSLIGAAPLRNAATATPFSAALHL